MRATTNSQRSAGSLALRLAVASLFPFDQTSFQDDKPSQCGQSESIRYPQSFPAAPLQSFPAAPLQSFPAAPLQSFPAAPLQSFPPATLESLPPASLDAHPLAPLQSQPSAPIEQSLPPATVQSLSSASPQSHSSAASQSSISYDDFAPSSYSVKSLPPTEPVCLPRAPAEGHHYRRAIAELPKYYGQSLQQIRTFPAYQMVTYQWPVCFPASGMTAPLDAQQISRLVNNAVEEHWLKLERSNAEKAAKKAADELRQIPLKSAQSYAAIERMAKASQRTYRSGEAQATPRLYRPEHMIRSY